MSEPLVGSKTYRCLSDAISTGRVFRGKTTPVVGDVVWDISGTGFFGSFSVVVVVRGAREDRTSGEKGNEEYSGHFGRLDDG